MFLMWNPDITPFLSKPTRDRLGAFVSIFYKQAMYKFPSDGMEGNPRAPPAQLSGDFLFPVYIRSHKGRPSTLAFQDRENA